MMVYKVRKRSDMIDIGLAYYFKYGEMPTKKSVAGNGLTFYSFREDVTKYFNTNGKYHEYLETYSKEISRLKVRICHTCGEIFSSKNSDSEFPEFCSETCLIDSNLYNACKRCNKVFNPKDGYEQLCDQCKEDISDGIPSIQDIKRSNKSKNNIEDAMKLLITNKVTEIINKSKETGNIHNNVLINYWNIGGFNESVKDEVKKRDNYQCYICEKDMDLHVHHIIPRRKGGNHDLDNLVTLCSSCHMAIETGDIDHAIKKCTKNALKYSGLSEQTYTITDSYKVSILQKCLMDIFEELSNDDSNSDILINISKSLGRIGE